MVPAVIPETTPVADMPATAPLLLLHTPPVVASLNWVVDAGQTVALPAIAERAPLTVIDVLTEHPPEV